MDEKLKELQKVQIEILTLIDQICNENNLRYSLYAGTLLGAVRHEGFIPWDDDLDVCMPREDYDRFIEIWNKNPQEGYLLQNKENTPRFTQSFSKIRKDHTTFLQYEFERDAYHTGIFVDIFPIDYIPNSKIKRTIFKGYCIVYQLLTREFIPKKANKVVQLVSTTILGCVRGKKRDDLRRKLYKKITRYKTCKGYNMVATETIEMLNILYPSGLFDNMSKLKFENNEYSCFAEARKYLKLTYGNYMQLPPVEERVWKHHPIILDFEKNYGEE